jgi:predicted Rossmann fold flavoprotein
MKKRRKLIVVGGGASGFFCAVNAAHMDPELEVVILEKSSKLLSKVKISGGGRCNVTHAGDDIPELTESYPRGKHFVRKTLHQFPPAQTIAWFAERGISLKTEADGRMFPETDQSQTIIDCLMEEASRYDVKILLRMEVNSIQPIGEKFILAVSGEHQSDEMMEADMVCVAAGGHPKVEGFSFLDPCGHAIVTPVPSLFTFNIQDKQLHALMGVVNKDSVVRIPGLKLQESGPVLITHWGLSGPAVLKLSARAATDLQALAYRFTVTVNWTPAYHESTALEALKQVKQESRQEAGGKNPFGLTARFWTYLLTKAGIDGGKKWPDLNNTQLVGLSRLLTCDQYAVNGKTTFKEEFVTAGGVSLKEINPMTMESKLCKGLYFAGEVMDVDGITGGYNFQHAWSSGWIAAKSITSKN